MKLPALLLLLAASVHAEEAQRKASFLPDFSAGFKDPSDGSFDLSAFLDQPFGFFPLVTPITEPAVGYGAAFMPVFIDLPEDGKGRPDIWAAGGMATQNGSRGLMGGYSGYFDEDRWHVFGGAMDVSVNFDFNGLGGVQPSGDPLRYNLDMTGGMIGADRKIGSTDWRAGLRYFYAEVDPSLVHDRDFPIIDSDQFQNRFGDFDPSSTISSLQVSLSYDTRDNIFTPTRGLFSEFDLTANLEALGGSTDYQLVQWTGIWYRPLVEDCLFLGWRADAAQSFGEVPFYRRPFVSLRGAPAMEYQGAGLISTEVELRWQFHPRWSLVGFGGAGYTWPGDEPFGSTENVFTGGGGIRYLIARRHGMHVGVDVAGGQDGAAVYIQFGSGWFRP